MKLHLVIAVVICMRAAMANLTPVVVEHGQLVTEAARSGTPILRNLRSDIATAFTEKLEKALALYARQHFAYEAKPALSEEEFVKIMQEVSEEKKLEKLEISWKDVNLLRNPNLQRWLNHDSNEDFESKCKLVFENLLKAQGDDIIAMVKTVNAGFLDSEGPVRDMASNVQSRMLNKWTRDNKWSIPDVFKKLNLDLIKDESELYANPAFATWVKFAHKVKSNLMAYNIYEVLRKEENSKNFKGLAEYGQYIESGVMLPAAKQWEETMKHIPQKQKSWYKIVRKQD